MRLIRTLLNVLKVVAMGCGMLVFGLVNIWDQVDIPGGSPPDFFDD